MTDQRLRYLLDIWRQRLGLAHWHIEMRAGGCDSETSYFEIERQSAYARAVICYQPWLLTGQQPDSCITLELTDQVIETGLVHELMHCHTIGMLTVVDDDLDGLLQPDVGNLLRRSFHREEEHCVDSVAYALVNAWTDRS